VTRTPAFLPTYPLDVEHVLLGLESLVRGTTTLLGGDGPWMVWNLLLAMVPAVFAIVLFRPGTRREPLWWGGVAVFVLFLPNAPYVLTDALHLFEQIRITDSDLQVLGIVLPVYGTFFAIGFGCYVLALRRVRDYVRHERARHAADPERSATIDGTWLLVAASLHALCALGIFLGRVLRLNSWNVVTHPGSVVDAVRATLQGFPLTIVSATFVMLVVLTATSNLIVDAGIVRARRLVDRLHRPA
jgi:uncharacterized membrane protein